MHGPWAACACGKRVLIHYLLRRLFISSQFVNKNTAEDSEASEWESPFCLLQE